MAKVKKRIKLIHSEQKVLEICQKILKKLNLEDRISVGFLDKMCDPGFYAQCAYLVRGKEKLCAISFNRKKCLKGKKAYTAQGIKEIFIHEICHAIQYFNGVFEGITIEEEFRKVEHNKEFYFDFFDRIRQTTTTKRLRGHYVRAKFYKHKSPGWKKQIKFLPTITELRERGLYEGLREFSK